MDEQHTEGPWSSDVAGIIYAVNGRPGQTTVATLQPDANPELLAAAPDLLWALVNAVECLEAEYSRVSSGSRMLAVLDARDHATTAIAHATVGREGSHKPERRWAVNPELPSDERKANERLLDSAAELHKAIKKTFAALAGHVDAPDVIEPLRDAMVGVGDLVPPAFEPKR